MSIVIKCDFCGKETKKKPSRVHPRNFCNSECYHKWRKTLVGELNYNWKGGKITKICVSCGKEFKVCPSLKDTQIYCSRDCAKYRKWLSGENHPQWKGGEQTYICQWCGDEFTAKPILINKYCSRSCTAKARRGEFSSSWKGGLTSTNIIIRNSKKYSEWRNKIYERDNWTCQDCGKRGNINLEAHHIKPFATYPELRFDINNGITLCKKCHRNNGYHNA